MTVADRDWKGKKTLALAIKGERCGETNGFLLAAATPFALITLKHTL